MKVFFRKLFCFPIRFYQKFISPLFPPCCRFTPTCSQYAVEAIERFGLFKGGFLSLKRILRCNPYSKGGYDSVPLKFCKKDIFCRKKIKKSGDKIFSEI